MNALPEDFLPSLGLNFLANVYYPAYVNNPYGEVLVAILDSKVVGFIQLATNPEKYLDWIIKEKFLSLSWYLFRLGLRKPRRILEAIAIAQSKTPKLAESAEIAILAVKPSMQRLGIGSALINFANNYSLKKGLNSIYIKTLSSNFHVINMYQNNCNAEILFKINILNKSYVYIACNLINT
ncbi:MAG: GNAT family N-acetyltransferase [Symploca sp. SIO1B1]|nr:GNAT family N-acetyltransferase [Symploca sp. SIO1B1]